mgnify:CR=1 FL=1
MSCGRTGFYQRPEQAHPAPSAQFKLEGDNTLKRAILCECGEFIKGHTFKEYIPTSINPSTPTFGHSGCGLIFDLVDGKLPKRFSSRVQLKGIAMRFAEMNKMEETLLGSFLLEVDRLKSAGNISDIDILIEAHNTILKQSSKSAD